MNRDYKFAIDQRIKMKSEDGIETLTGTVFDKTRDSIFVKWDQRESAEEIPDHKFDKITLINGKNGKSK